MKLFILRHGLAAEPNGLGRDAERPLTKKGIKKMECVARGMKQLGLEFDRILSSPYKRARQTAEIVACELKAQKRLECTDLLVPHAATKKLVEHLAGIAPAPGRVLLVGHEPFLSGLVSQLVCGDREASMTLKKGGLVKLSVDKLAEGRCAALEWLVTPKLMELVD